MAESRNATTGLRIDWDLDCLAWADALVGCRDATFFHTDAWLRTVSRLWGTRIERARFTLDDGHVALLPISVRPLLGGQLPLAIAGETGEYGGLTASRPLSEREARAILAAVRLRYPAWRWTGNPFACGPHLPEGGTIAETHLLELRPIEELRKGFNRGCKAACNRARRRGPRLVMTVEPAAADAFYGVYADSVQRWGSTLTWRRPREFFRVLIEEAAPAARLFLAYQDGRLVSGLVLAAHGPAVHYIAGATLASALEDSPSNFLMEEALAYYARCGFPVFDFGSSNGLEGVRRYKESFGAKPASYATARSDTLATRLYFAARSPYERLRDKLPSVLPGHVPPAVPRPLAP